MTEEQLKTLLQNFEMLNAQIQTWNICLLYESNNLGLQQKLKKSLLQINILTKGLQIINSKEKFIIENHLISKKTWEETYTLYEDYWGIQNGRSLRTLNRMQYRALQKMLRFIRESDLEYYLE